MPDFDPNLYDVFKVAGKIGFTVDWDQGRRNSAQYVNPPDGAWICGIEITGVSQTNSSRYIWKILNRNQVYFWFDVESQGTFADRKRGWVDLDFELTCCKRKPGNEAPEACPISQNPAEGGGGSMHDADGEDCSCISDPTNDNPRAGMMWCFPYEIDQSGKKVFLGAYMSGFCYKDG